MYLESRTDLISDWSSVDSLPATSALFTSVLLVDLICQWIAVDFWPFCMFSITPSAFCWLT